MSFVSLVVQLVVCVLVLRWLLKCRSERPFPKKAVVKFLLFGALSALVILISPISLKRDQFFGLNPLLAGFLTAFITAALLEEVAKYLFFRLALIKDKNVTTWHDCVMACILVGMGFLIFEDLEFAITGSTNILRAIIPGHLLFQAWMGYFYGKAKVTKKSIYHVLSLVVPIAIHTLFDMFLISLMSIVEVDGKIADVDTIMTHPYVSYMIPLAVCAIVVLIATLVALVKTLKLVGNWGKNNELQDKLNGGQAAA